MSEYLQRLRPRSLHSKTNGKPISSQTGKRSRSPSEELTEEQRSLKKLISRKNYKRPTSPQGELLRETATNSKEETGGETSLPKKRILSKSDVDRVLLDAGVEQVGDVCLCVKAAIRKGHISLNMDSPLDQVILSMPCPICSAAAPIVVRLSDVLFQGDKGDFYWGFDSNIECSDCETQLAVMRMCQGFPVLNSGKQYNHCSLCPGFGRCIGDYRKSHCDSCERHYFAGSLGELSCGVCYSSDSDGDSILGNSKTAKESPNFPIFSYLYSKQDVRMSALMQLVQRPSLPQLNKLDASDTDSN